MTRLHLGCGHIRLPGYVNIDIMAAKAADVIADLRKLPYGDARVDLVYSCAAIEHFCRREWVDVKSWEAERAEDRKGMEERLAAAAAAPKDEKKK